MKKIALLVALMGVFGSAQASGLSVDTSGHMAAGAIAGYDGQPVPFTGAVTSGFFGELKADVAGTITFTFLGQESGHVNQFNLSLAGALFEGGVAGSSSISSFINAGSVDFRFIDTQPEPDVAFANGQKSTAVLGFAFLNAPIANPLYQYYIGFNDTFDADADYDDFVVGINFTPNAVPVPAALPLMASALALFGFGASRRRI